MCEDGYVLVVHVNISYRINGKLIGLFPETLSKILENVAYVVPVWKNNRSSWKSEGIGIHLFLNVLYIYILYTLCTILWT